MDTQTYINELFADSLFQEFNDSRYGITGCKKNINPESCPSFKIVGKINFFFL